VNSLYSGLVNYTHPTGDGNLHVPATSTTNNGKVLTAGATDGSLSWSALTSSQWTTAGSDIYYNTGNVGIGTTTPGYKLTVQGGEIVSASDGTDGLVFTGTDGTANDMSVRYDRPNARLEFRDNLNSETRMVIKQDGNVGIGTTTPAYKLDVAGDVNVTGNFKVNGVNISNGSAFPRVSTITGMATSGTEYNLFGGTAVMPSNGDVCDINLGIDNSGSYPACKFTIEGQRQCRLYCNRYSASWSN